MSCLPILRVKKDDWFFQIRYQPFFKHLSAGGPGCDIVVPGCTKEKVNISCDGINEELRISATGAILENKKAEAVFSLGVRNHVRIQSSSGEAVFSVLSIPAFAAEVPLYDRSVSVKSAETVTVGNSLDAQLVTRIQCMPDIIFRLQMGAQGLKIIPSDYVPGGVWLNTEKLDGPSFVADGDFITCAGFHACWLANKLLLPTSEGVEVRSLHYLDDSEHKSHLEYPLINRMSRQTLTCSTEDIQVLDPPTKPEQSKNRLFMSLLPSVAMVGMTLAMRSSFSSSGNMMLFSALSMGIGGVTTTINYFSNKKEFRQKTEKRETVYKAYIQSCEETIRKAREQEQETLRRIYISPDQELQNIEDFSAELFDRSSIDSDFLDIRLGCGAAESRRHVTYRKHETFEEFDELFRMPKMLAEQYRYVEKVPIIISAKTANAIGLVGSQERLAAMARNLILDIAERHYFQDVHLYAFLSESFQREKEACRLLPHFRNSRLNRRNISHDDESYNILSEDLYKHLSEREQIGKLPDTCPWLVVLVDDERLMQHPLMRYIPRAAELHCVFLFFLENRELMPKGCSDLVMLFNNRAGGVKIPLNHPGSKQLFDYENVGAEDLRKVSERLAPVYSGQLSLAAKLSSHATLYEMLAIDKPTAETVLAAWGKADTAASLGAPLGIRENQTTLELDLHEKVHGPHGLVAGTTGSGKSQVLISYVLSLASRYSPEDVNFAVIDFKGGDIVKHLPGLPHIVGSITNLNKREIERSRRAINAEKMRRMLLFDAPDVKVGNISEYTKAYRKGIARIPLPHLILIVDEFAELKQQYPEFMQDLISLSRVGRSLGIHLILCTQKPAGVVDPQIWGNSDFKLCLRVQSKEDSNEVIRSPLAAEIREPGRGYLQVGRTDQFELFQSGYSGVPEIMQKDQPYQILERSLSGKNRVLFQHKVKAADENAITQREALLKAVCEAWKESGLKQPFQLCMPQIPDKLIYDEPALESEYAIPVGLYDAPDEQAIRTLSLDLLGENVLIKGASQMGKTNLLQVLLRRLAESYTTNDVRVYAMDFNANALKNMESLSIVSGVVTPDDEEKLKNLLRLLKAEVAARKQFLMKERVTTFASYRAIHPDAPLLVVMVDNLALFKELYDEKYGNDMSFLLREGPALGITFVVTVQQMNALGYRDGMLFTNRIAMPMGEQSEYSAFFGTCRVEPKNVPGRVLILRDKQFFEGQIYEAFTPEMEAADEDMLKNDVYIRQVEQKRAQMIDQFLTEHSKAPKAGRIPEVPKVLTTELIRELFGETPETKFPIGMEYSSVQPAWLDLNRQFILALMGRNASAIRQMTDRFLYTCARLGQQEKALLFLVDGYDRPYRQWEHVPGVTRYTNSPEELEELLKKAYSFLETRMEEMREHPEMEIYPLVFVIHSADIAMMFTKDASEQIKKIAEKFRRAGILFFFTEVENKNIGFSAPDVMKLIRDQRQAVLLDDLGAIKAYDGFTMALQRANSRPLEDNEAFMLNGDEVNRVRLVTDPLDQIISSDDQ